MAGYRVLIKRSAAKEIEAIGTKRERLHIVSRIGALASEPRPQGCEKLAATAAPLRVRQGSYRIIYSVDDARATIEIIKVGHRREVHRSQ